MLERGRTLAERWGSESYLLRCLAPLAEASGSAEVLDEAQAMLDAMTLPPGAAWLTGEGAYLAVARAWLARGEPLRARGVLAPMLAAAERVPWVAPLAAGSLVSGRAALVLGSTEEARALFVRAETVAGRFRMTRVHDDAGAQLRAMG